MIEWLLLLGTYPSRIEAAVLVAFAGSAAFYAKTSRRNYVLAFQGGLLSIIVGAALNHIWQTGGVNLEGLFGVVLSQTLGRYLMFVGLGSLIIMLVRIAKGRISKRKVFSR